VTSDCAGAKGRFSFPSSEAMRYVLSLAFWAIAM
jgi:hypothetical protein